jgi:hypothetical protein
MGPVQQTSPPPGCLDAGFAILQQGGQQKGGSAGLVGQLGTAVQIKSEGYCVAGVVVASGELHEAAPAVGGAVARPPDTEVVAVVAVVVERVRGDHRPACSRPGPPHRSAGSPPFRHESWPEPSMPWPVGPDGCRAGARRQSGHAVRPEQGADFPAEGTADHGCGGGGCPWLARGVPGDSRQICAGLNQVEWRRKGRACADRISR